MTWMSDYIPQKTMHVITYPYPRPVMQGLGVFFVAILNKLLTK